MEEDKLEKVELKRGKYAQKSGVDRKVEGERSMYLFVCG